MQIKVYPSLLEGEPLETYQFDGTLGQWFESKGIDYLAQDTQPIVVRQNGFPVPTQAWATLTGDVEIRLLPHGGVFKALGGILGAVFGLFFGFLMPKAKNNQSSPQQGKKLEVATATANQARLGEVVPELAGRFRRYPDYLTPPRRHFVNRREQWLEFLACIGPGSYQINAADVKVGDTPFSGLGSDGSYQIHSPGANLSGVTAHEHWHTVTEVGGTSSGTAGLELPVDRASTYHTPVPAYEFSGVTIAVPAGTGAFPDGWGVGTVVSINLPLSYSVTLQNIATPPMTNNVNVFTGDFRHLLPLSNGDKVNVTGANINGEFEAVRISLDSQGYGTISLGLTVPDPTEEDPDRTKFVYVKDAQTGTRTMTFIRGAYTLLNATPEFLTLDGRSFAPITAAATIQYLSGPVYGKWTSTFAACPESETTNLLELDFFFPGGLARISDEGDLENKSVQAEIQYRDAAVGGAYTSVMKTYEQNTLDQIGFTERIAVSGIRPEVRVRRVGVVDTSTQVQDKIHWYGLKSRLPTKTSYPNWTTMSIKIRSGGRLAAQSENQINVIATRVLPTLQSNGTWSAPVATRDISAFIKYIATTIGYDDSNINMTELLRLHNIWKSRGETLDHVYELTTVKEALSLALGAGMAELTVDDGVIKPVRDDVRTQFEQGYSSQNMTQPLTRSFRTQRPDDHDGVEVEFINGSTWAKEVVQCRLPGDQGFKVLKIKLDGVTSRTRAWRIGMRERRVMRYRNWDYSFETELDALNSGYLSYVPLIADVPGYGQSTIIEYVESVSGGVMLTSSEPLVWADGKTHIVAYRRPDGTVAGPYTADKGVDDYTVIADIPNNDWPTVTLKHEPPHLYFGTSERWTFPALITEIDPNGLERVRVRAENYDVRVYADDNNAPT